MLLYKYRYSKIRITACPAEVPLFSQKYNATDTAVILTKEEPPTPLHLRHRSHLLPTSQQLPGCESFNKLLLPPGTHTPTTRTTHGQEKIPNIRIIIIIVFIIRLIYIFIDYFSFSCSAGDTKRERKDGTQRKNTTIIQSVYL